MRSKVQLFSLNVGSLLHHELLEKNMLNTKVCKILPVQVYRLRFLFHSLLNILAYHQLNTLSDQVWVALYNG